MVTGGTSGVGKAASVDLLRAGYDVVVGARSPERGAGAARDIEAAAGSLRGGGSVEVLPLDLASLRSVRAFAAAVRERTAAVDVLLANAGVMALPERTLTEDGFEAQLAVNHLSHFLLTSLLLEPLCESGSARVVVTSSVAHLFGAVCHENLQSEGVLGYPALGWVAYGQSKLANLFFTYELDRRLRRAGLAGRVAVNAAHPGFVDTALDRNLSSLFNVYVPMRALGACIDAERGSRGIVALALDPAYEGVSGKYVSELALQGRPGEHAVMSSSPASYDPEGWARLWDESNRLTGAEWPLLDAQKAEVSPAQETAPAAAAAIE